jgi:hypothetical protein
LIDLSTEASVEPLKKKTFSLLCSRKAKKSVCV